MKVTPTRPKRASRGIALVLVISITSVVVLVLLAMVTLSVNHTRIGTSDKEKARAEANARLALSLAVGQLQGNLGPDRRVSANARAMGGNPPNPHLTGVWESWQWIPEPDGKPDYSVKATRFRQWMVSHPDAARLRERTMPQGALPDAVDLIRDETAGDLVRYNDSAMDPLPGVKASLIPANAAGRSGKVAWATLDQSQSATVDPGPAASTALPNRVAARLAPERARADVLHGDLGPLRTARHLVTMETAELAVKGDGVGQLRGRTQDLTRMSLGLLTDVVNGGLKWDLTQVFDSTAAMSTFFAADAPYLTAALGAPRWDYLRNVHQVYKRVKSGTGATGRPTVVVGSQDLRISSSGITDAPQVHRLLPVVSKLQLMFSIVSHHAHIGDRVNFYENSMNPRGNAKYAVPHLVYDPVITLYNPFDVALELNNLRVRVWDPPVGFQFFKNGLPVRPEFAGGDYHGLARFQIANEKNTAARKAFTLFLTESRSGRPGGRLTLLPGETRVFSPWVESNWTWGLESSGGYVPRAFFDWNASDNLGNVDYRTKNAYGLETLPGYDARAGLQTDHLSYASGRPANTVYPGEWSPGWVNVLLTDTFRVRARPQRVTSSGSDPDFRFDILAGQNTDPERDLVRRFDFRFQDVTAEISAAGGSANVVDREFLVGDILQAPADASPGGKTPFAVLTMAAKTTMDPADDSKAWLYNNPVVDGAIQDTRRVGLANQSYDLRFDEVQDFTSFPGVEMDAATKRGYFGASATANRGVSNVPMFKAPTLPAATLGDLIPANLLAGARLPRVNHPLGGSRAHPLVDPTIARGSATNAGIDHVFLLNQALWDRYFFSSACAYSGGLFSDTKSRAEVLRGFFTGEAALLNANLTPWAGSEGGPDQLSSLLDRMGDRERATRIAAHALVRGAFNLNSTSVDAWRAVLSSSRDAALPGWANTAFSNPGRSPFSRMNLPIAGAAETNQAAATDIRGQIRWAGFRSLDDSQIEALARAIVAEILRRGQADQAPMLSLAEFVNRRPGPPDALHAMAGLLEAAIAASGVNAAYHALDSRPVQFSTIDAKRTRGTQNPRAMDGWTAEGSPPILTQGDLMAMLAGQATIRGDTFRIRTCGESINALGKRTSRAFLEAIVQRLPEYLDPADASHQAADSLVSAQNRQFGRRFVVVSFRWLSPEEI